MAAFSASGAYSGGDPSSNLAGNAYRWASGFAAVAFSVTSRRSEVVPRPRARVHHNTIGEAIKIEE
jgi:hypothetical protein